MKIELEKFELQLVQAGKPAALIRIVDDGPEPDELLWLNAHGITHYVNLLGPHHALLQAGMIYGLDVFELVEGHRATGCSIFYGPIPVSRDTNGLWRHPEHPSHLSPDIFDFWIAILGKEHVTVPLSFEAVASHKFARQQSNEHHLGALPVPAGEGWYLVEIHARASSPCAVWVRDKPASSMSCTTPCQADAA